MNYLQINYKLQFKYPCLAGLTTVNWDLTYGTFTFRYILLRMRLIVGLGVLSVELPLLLLVLSSFGPLNYHFQFSIAHSLSL